MLKLEDNVKKLKMSAIEVVANYEGKNFSIEMYNQMEDYKIISPIEQILFIAINTLIKITSLGETEPINIHGEQFITGLGVLPQKEIGKYRADFLISNGKIEFENKKRKQIFNQVIVECDSQQFHDRTEKERRYEKTRDRYFQKLGYKVFRFTGKEITENPFKVATEIICFLTEEKEEDILSQLSLFGGE